MFRPTRLFLDFPSDDIASLQLPLSEFLERLENSDSFGRWLATILGPVAGQESCGLVTYSADDLRRRIEPVLPSLADEIECVAIGLDAAAAVRAHYAKLQPAPEPARRAPTRGPNRAPRAAAPKPQRSGKTLDSVLTELRRIGAPTPPPMIAQGLGMRVGTVAIVLGQALRRGLVSRDSAGAYALPEWHPAPAPAAAPRAPEHPDLELPDYPPAAAPPAPPEPAPDPATGYIHAGSSAPTPGETA